MPNYTSAYNRMLATCLREFEREIKQTVGRKFARMLEAIQAGEEVEIPVIGGELPPSEHRTGEYFTELQAKVVRALCCKKWFEFEAAPWAQPLPLTEDDCIARYNAPGVDQRYSREYLVGRYGLELRQYGWHYERASKFEVFCADQLRPPGFW